jgi:hypothetical protein
MLKQQNTYECYNPDINAITAKCVVQIGENGFKISHYKKSGQRACPTSSVLFDKIISISDDTEIEYIHGNIANFVVCAYSLERPNEAQQFFIYGDLDGKVHSAFSSAYARICHKRDEQLGIF